MAVSKLLDDIDLKILQEVQADGRITNVDLARRVGISPPPCLRRLRALEEAGFIRGYRGVLDGEKLGFAVTVFVAVQLASQAEPDLRSFEAVVAAEPFIRECWMLSGDTDFMLKCVAPDLASFQALVARLTTTPQVRNVRTSLVLQNIKREPDVPFGLGPQAVAGRRDWR